MLVNFGHCWRIEDVLANFGHYWPIARFWQNLAAIANFSHFWPILVVLPNISHFGPISVVLAKFVKFCRFCQAKMKRSLFAWFPSCGWFILILCEAWYEGCGRVGAHPLQAFFWPVRPPFLKFVFLHIGSHVPAQFWWENLSWAKFYLNQCTMHCLYSWIPPVSYTGV